MVSHRSKGIARGFFGSNGGVLEGPGGVSLTIPPGALPSDTSQEIYFTITETDANAVESRSNTRGHWSSISPPMHHGELILFESRWWI